MSELSDISPAIGLDFEFPGNERKKNRKQEEGDQSVGGATAEGRDRSEEVMGEALSTHAR